MSIAPHPKKEQFEMSKFDRIRHTLKLATNEYFKEPAYYLFYGSLVAVSIGLIFSADFPWQLYALIGFSGALQLWKKR